MGQSTSAAFNFCSTVISACDLCSRIEYDPILDKLGLMTMHHKKQSSNDNYDDECETTPVVMVHAHDNKYGSNKDKEEQVDEKEDDDSAIAIPKSDDGAHDHVHSDEKTKFRAFIIAYHRTFGYLLLRAYKKNKGSHYQLPGGHIDKSEMYACSMEDSAKKAAMRELFEETGLHIHDDSRLKCLKLGIKSRIYFQLLLRDDDSLHLHNVDKKVVLNASLMPSQTFYLRLSSEHNAFVFEKDIDKSIEMVRLHSGGKNSDALTVYAQHAKHEKKTSATSHHDCSKKQKKKRKKDKH